MMRKLRQNPGAVPGWPPGGRGGSLLSELRTRIPREEFDYQTLLLSLKEYSSPRDKITTLLRQRVIIRVKKGIYVFGEALRRRPPSREVLANLLYGPSYISLEYALQFHGLIPEAVEAVTSVTCGRSRRFETPLGEFSYRMIPLRAYREGATLVRQEHDISWLIAVPEKALADKLVSDRGTAIRNLGDLRSYLLDSLRIDPADLARLDPVRTSTIAQAYRSYRLRLLSRLVRDLKLTTENS